MTQVLDAVGPVEGFNDVMTGAAYENLMAFEAGTPKMAVLAITSLLTPVPAGTVQITDVEDHEVAGQLTPPRVTVPVALPKYTPLHIKNRNT